MEYLSNVRESLTFPTNDEQAKQLRHLKPSEQVQVWEEVTDRYEPTEITASKIKEVKQETHIANMKWNC